jgi:hypothetical protein
MWKDVEGSGRKLILRYYRGIPLERLRKTTKHFSNDSRSLGRDLNPGYPNMNQECRYYVQFFRVGVYMKLL